MADTEEEEPGESTHVDGKTQQASEQAPEPTTGEPDASEPEPNTAVIRNMVSIDDHRALKATLELHDLPKDFLPQGPVDDGWGGGSPESTGAQTGNLGALDDLQRTGDLQGISAAFGGAGVDDDPEAPRLICIQGPDEGREYVLKSRDVSIGRAMDNDVVLNDPSVSRLHCRILIDEGRYVATDQRSGNGTIVNGRRIERQSLSSGNTLKMGQSVLRFIEMGDVIKSTETASHKAIEMERITQHPITSTKKRPQAPQSSMRWALLIVAVALLLGAAIVVFSISGRSASNAVITQTPAEIAETALQDAETALQAKKLDVARERHVKARNARPDNPRVALLLTRIEREERTLGVLEQTKHLASAGAFIDAYRILGTAPKDSLFRSDVIAARVELDHATEAKLNELDPDVLLGVLPDDSPLRAEVKRRKAKEATPPPAPAHRPEKETPRERPARSEKQERPDKSESSTAKRALDAFVAGQADNALELLGGDALDDGSLALKNKILKFQDVFKAAKSAAEDKRPDADAQLRKALAFESKIAFGKSNYAAQLRRSLSEAAYDSGVRLQGEQRLLEAYRSFKEAIANGDQPQARKRLGDLQAQARDVFNQGYILKDSDKNAARDKWQRVLSMVPPEDDAYQKAKKWLDQTK